MAKKKEEPKALFSVKHDFVAALENVSLKGIMLLQAVQQAIELGAVTEGQVAAILSQRAKEFRAALSEES